MTELGAVADSRYKKKLLFTACLQTSLSPLFPVDHVSDTTGNIYVGYGSRSFTYTHSDTQTEQLCWPTVITSHLRNTSCYYLGCQLSGGTSQSHHCASVASVLMVRHLQLAVRKELLTPQVQMTESLQQTASSTSVNIQVFNQHDHVL